MAGTPQKLTYDDLVNLPQDGRRCEVLDGELIVTPSPASQHQIVLANLGSLLHRHVKEQRLGVVMFAPMDVVLDAHTIVEPDILFVHSARSGIIERHAIVGPPDLCVEITSPSTLARDRGAKAKLYARFGVEHYWIVDPTGCTLETFVLRQGTYAAHLSHAGDAVVRSDPFPSLSIALSEIWI